MKIVNYIRTELYPFFGSCFTKMNVSPNIIEVGVCHGNNLRSMLQGMDPNSAVLVDQWIPYSPFKDAIPGTALYDQLSNYFGGPVDDPKTYENSYNYCVSEFGTNQNKIVRKDSISAAAEIATFNQKYDLIYIDGGHLYEEVLADLNAYESLVGNNGILMLDDFMDPNSEGSKVQHLGVVPAVLEFLQNHPEYQPSIITRPTPNAWSNIVLTKRDSIINDVINNELISTGVFFVEVPDNLIHSYRNSQHENCLRF